MNKYMKPSQHIMQAMEVIGDKSRWTKGQIARNANGKAREPHNEDACKFCSVGALYKVNEGYNAFECSDYLNKAARNIYKMHIIDFNDSPSTKHSDVMNVFMTASLLALADGN